MIKRGFTLIELIIVIAVIGVLAGGIVAIINPVAQFQKANDAKRKSDLNQIQKGLELYYQDNGRYPVAISDKIMGLEWGSQWLPYMGTLSQDPSSTKNYIYASSNNQQTYYLYASLDRGVNDQQACSGGSVCLSLLSGVSCGLGAICNYGVSSSDVDVSEQRSLDNEPTTPPAFIPSSTPATPTPAPAGQTVVTFCSNPSSSEVWLDYGYRGLTPMSLAVSAGNHHIGFFKSGYNNGSALESNFLLGNTDIGVNGDLLGGQITSGETACPALNSSYTITANVFVDSDGNTIWDTGEVGFSGATVSISSPGAPSSAATNSSGQYIWTASAGNYTVSLSLPGGYTATTAISLVSSVGPNAVVNFGIKLNSASVIDSGMRAISLVFYSACDAATNQRIVNAKPGFIFIATPNGPWHTASCNTSIFSAVGIKPFSYISAGYEGGYWIGYNNNFPYDLNSNLAFIDAIAANEPGTYGIFLDEVDIDPDYPVVWGDVNVPRTAAQAWNYISQISVKAHSKGLKLLCNVGSNSWNDRIMDYCDYVMSTEQYYLGQVLTASQQKWKSRTVMVSVFINDAATAIQITNQIISLGFLGGYAGPYTILPTWWESYYPSIPISP